MKEKKLIEQPSLQLCLVEWVEVAVGRASGDNSSSLGETSSSLLLKAKVMSLSCQLTAPPPLPRQEEGHFLFQPHGAVLDVTQRESCRELQWK